MKQNHEGTESECAKQGLRLSVQGAHTGVPCVQAQRVSAGGLLLPGKVKCAGRMEGELRTRRQVERWGLWGMWPEPWLRVKACS